MKQSMCTGIDVGYGFTKVVEDSKERIDQGIWLSVVGNLEERTIEIEGLKLSSLDCIEVDDQKLLVGDSALKHSSRTFSRREKGWIGSVAYKALMKKALLYSTHNGINSVIVSGLPVTYFKTDKDKLTAIIKEIAREEGILARIKVIPQPLGSFFYLLFNESGHVQDESLINSRVGVGFYTSDLITIDNLELPERQIASFENGVAETLESISRDIENVYGLKLDLHKTEVAIRKGSVRVYGVDRDIASIDKKRLSELAGEIEARAKTIWKSAADLDQVILTGGGAPLLKNYLSLYRHAMITEDAQFTNAYGYYKYARRINNGG